MAEHDERTAESPVPRVQLGADDGKTPGKRTRTQTEIAAGGVSGAGEPMPFRKIIQKSFGKHDISNVRAYRDDGAKQANAELGAHGYATGNRMALFSDTPDLHTVAHEAAHIVQQRPLALKGGAHDAYEAHADAVADAVVAGRSAEPLLDTMVGSTSPRVQKKSAAHSHAAPQGVVAISIAIDGATLSILTDGDRLVIDLVVGDDHATIAVSAQELLKQLAGEIALDIQRITELIQHFKAVVKQTGTLVRIPLGGAADKPNFVVLDLKRVAASIGTGTLDLRPVEAQLTAGPVGVKVFANDQIKASQAIPGEPIGGWFEVPDDGAIRHALGADGAGSVWAGVFYEDGRLRIAVKPSEAAKTGIVGEIDLLAILDKLKSLGERVATWLSKLKLKSHGGSLDWLRVLAGKLHFSLPDMPGTWFDFDLKLQLPKLWHGGGFHLPNLWPTSFHIDLGGLSLGALPKLKFPWLHAPKLGGFNVSLDKLRGLLGSISLPKIPALDFDLHFAGGFKLGLGIDLSALGAEFADLAFGIELDILALLQKLGDAGKWLVSKIRAGADWVQKWIHLGSDGVLRIYDREHPDGPMLGFHLLRLLDGADATDLAPTELRWHPDAKDNTVGIELGETGMTPGPMGKTAPQKPGGTLVVDKKNISIDQVPSIATTLALKPKATVLGQVYYAKDHVTVWAEADSAVYDHPQAFKGTVDIGAIKSALVKHIPANKRGGSHLPEIKLDQTLNTFGPRFTFEFPDTIGGAARAGKLFGSVGWKVERLLGATDWTALVPDELVFGADGAGKIEVGKLHPPGPKLLDDVLAVHAPKGLRHDILHVDPDDGSVFLAAYKAGDIVAISISPDATATTGVLAQVELHFLLEQLKKLGHLGAKILDAIASKLKLPGWKMGSGDPFARVKEIAKLVIDKVRMLAGKLHIDFGGGNFLGWDLSLGLPHFAFDLDLGKLLPEFHFDFPELPGLSLSFNLDVDIDWPGLLPGGGFRLPSLDLSWLLGSLPGFDVGMPIDIALHFLGNLFGLSFHINGRHFGVKFPSTAIIDAFKKVGAWLGNRFDDVKSLASWLHLGGDGVLRVWKPGEPNGDRVGFDLRQLLRSGLAFESLVPSEVHVAVGGTAKAPAAEMSVGTTQVAGKHETGTVLVPKPAGNVIAQDRFLAPKWLAEHLGVAPTAYVRAQLIMTQDGASASAFASVEHSDRGAEITIHTAVLQQMTKSINLAKMPAADKLKIDGVASQKKGMLVVAFQAGTMHGYAGWKVQHLLSSPLLDKLIPDELSLGVGHSRLALKELDLKDLHPVGKPISTSLVPTIKEVLGDGDIIVYANNFGFDVDAHIAVAKVDNKSTAPIGIELDVGHELVAKLRHGFDQAIASASSAIGRAMSKTQRAGVTAGIHLGIQVKATSRGVKITRGEDTDPRQLYALYGWEHLSKLIANFEAGAFDLGALAPDEWRVATGAMSLEVTEPKQVSALPPNTHKVEALHPILRDALVALGLAPKQRVELDLERSKVSDDRGTMLSAVGHVYTMDDADKTVTHATEIKFGTTIEAVLAQVLPMKRMWKGKGVAAKDPAAGHTSAAAGITPSHDHDGNVDGIGMAVDVIHRSRKGDKREFHVEVGWTLTQLLDMLMHYADVFDDDGMPKGDAASYLVPDHIKGSFETDNFKLTIANDGSASKYNCHASDLPGLDKLLEAVLDKAAAQAAMLHLNIPSATQLAHQFLDSHGKWIPLGGCALELPKPGGASKFYSVTLELSPWLLKKLLYLIPVAGEIIALIDKVGSLLKDPVETFNEFRYAPEILGDILDNAPEIYGKLKEKGWKGVALALVMGGDVQTKQAVMAGRIYKKMKAAGWEKKGDKKTGDISQIPEEYLEWLSTQDADALIALDKLGDEAKAKGVEPPEDFDYAIPDKRLSVADIQLKELMVENSYTYFDHVKKSAKPNDPASQAEVAKAAEQTRAQITRLIKAGARQSAMADPNQQSVDADARVVNDDYSDITKLPPPSPEDEDKARKMFTNQKIDGGIVMSSVEIDYLIKKYSSRSADELAQLLATGSLIVDGVALSMAESERPFVRGMFAMKAHLAKSKSDKDDLKKAPTGGDRKDPTADDKKLLAQYQAKKSADSLAANKTKKPAKKKKGPGEGGDDYDADLDAAFGDEELDTASSDGTEGKDGVDGDKAPKDNKHAKDKNKADVDVTTGGGAKKDSKSPTSPRSLRDIFGSKFTPDFARQRVTVDGDAVRENKEQIQRDIAGKPTFVDDEGHQVLIKALSANGHKISDAGDPDPVYEFTVGVVFEYVDPAERARPERGATYTFFTHKGNAKEEWQWDTYADGMVDGGKLIMKLSAAIVWNGSAFAPASGKATVDHAGYTLTVVGVKSWQPLASKVHDAYEAEVELLLEKASTKTGTLIMKQYDGSRKVLHPGSSGTIRLPVYKK